VLDVVVAACGLASNGGNGTRYRSVMVINKTAMVEMFVWSILKAKASFGTICIINYSVHL
jgi:hypothetical protein